MADRFAGIQDDEMREEAVERDQRQRSRSRSRTRSRSTGRRDVGLDPGTGVGTRGDDTREDEPLQTDPEPEPEDEPDRTTGRRDVGLDPGTGVGTRGDDTRDAPREDVDDRLEDAPDAEEIERPERLEFQDSRDEEIARAVAEEHDDVELGDIVEVDREGERVRFSEAFQRRQAREQLETQIQTTRQARQVFGEPGEEPLIFGEFETRDFDIEVEDGQIIFDPQEESVRRVLGERAARQAGVDPEDVEIREVEDGVFEAEFEVSPGTEDTGEDTPDIVGSPFFTVGGLLGPAAMRPDETRERLTTGQVEVSERVIDPVVGRIEPDDDFEPSDATGELRAFQDAAGPFFPAAGMIGVGGTRPRETREATAGAAGTALEFYDPFSTAQFALDVGEHLGDRAGGRLQTRREIAIDAAEAESVRDAPGIATEFVTPELREEGMARERLQRDQEAISSFVSAAGEGIREDPARTIGIGVGAGLAVAGGLAAPRAAGQLGRASGRSRTNRGFLTDDRARLDLSGPQRRRGADVDLDEELRRFERAQQTRAAEARAERRVLDEQLEAARLQQRGDEPFVQPDPEFFTTSRPEFRTADPARATPAGQRTEFATRRRFSPPDDELSPLERQLFAQRQRERPTRPETDLREVYGIDTQPRSADAPVAPVAGETRRVQEAQEPDVFLDDELDAVATEPTQTPGTATDELQQQLLTAQAPGVTTAATIEEQEEELFEFGMTGVDVTTDVSVDQAVDVDTDTMLDVAITPDVRVAEDTALTVDEAIGLRADARATERARGRERAREATRGRERATGRARARARGRTRQRARARARSRTRRRVPPLIPELPGSDETRDEIDLATNAVDQVLTDFIDPLSGERIETNQDEEDVFGFLAPRDAGPSKGLFDTGEPLNFDDILGGSVGDTQARVPEGIRF